jgi:ParB family transcriptional regulator, chromosome partitioning protein
MHASANAALVRDIPLDKLKASPANVRWTDAQAGVEELAASIAAHGLLQSLVVMPERDGAGAETGRYLVVAGERRRKALRLLVKQKRLRKAEPIPCLVREDGVAEELSLAENVVRLPMHPADQFEAFARLKGQHLGIEEIAARFGVTPAVVRQRLKLAAVSPALLARYRAGELTLDQLMALTLTDDHARQEEVLSRLPSWSRSPEMIRRQLTEGHVGTRDRRVAFVGLGNYEAAGGLVLRDLFAEDQGGWLVDPVLLDRLVVEKLEVAAAAVREEGWKWVEASAEHPYQLTTRCRRVYPRRVELSKEEQARLEGLNARLNELEGEHAGEVPEEIAAEVERLSAELADLEARSRAYLPGDIALAGAVVSLGQNGELRVERGFVRLDDEPRSAEAVGHGDPKEGSGEASILREREAEDPRPLPDPLLMELTAERTAALQECLAARPEVALAAVVHALALRVFHNAGIGYDPGTCLDIEARPAKLGAIAPSLEEGKAGQAVARRHAEWAGRLPREREVLWGWVLSQDQETRLELLAYCAARTVDAVRRTGAGQRGLRHADELARTVGLDMAAWWAPTRTSYLGRVPKARILEAVREGVSEKDAASIVGLKKDAMVEHAERLLAGKTWLPEVLRPATVASDPSSAVAA